MTTRDKLLFAFEQVTHKILYRKELEDIKWKRIFGKLCECTRSDCMYSDRGRCTNPELYHSFPDSIHSYGCSMSIQRSEQK